MAQPWFANNGQVLQLAVTVFGVGLTATGLLRGGKSDMSTRSYSFSYGFYALLGVYALSMAGVVALVMDHYSWALIYVLTALLALSVLIAITVIRRSANRIVIVRAMYGPSDRNKPAQNVTEIVQWLITERGPSFLVDTATFGDDFVNEHKAMTVEYLYRGKIRRKTIAQDQWFNLP